MKKNWTLIVPENPTQYQVQKAIADRLDAEKPYEKIEVPQMKYPTSKAWRPTGIKGLMASIMP